MPDEFPHHWILERLDTMEQRLLDHSRGVRVDMVAGFRDMQAKFDKYGEDAQGVRDRVLTIETQRREEAKQSIKRGAWAGVVAAFGLTAIWEFIKHQLGWGAG